MGLIADIAAAAGAQSDHEHAQSHKLTQHEQQHRGERDKEQERLVDSDTH